MIPMMAVARPTRAEGWPWPRVMCNQPVVVAGGARGVGRKVKVMALKAEVWKARRNWARRVRRTLRV